MMRVKQMRKRLRSRSRGNHEGRSHREVEVPRDDLQRRRRREIMTMTVMRMMRVKQMRKRLRSRLRGKREERSLREVEVPRDDLQKERVSLLEVMMRIMVVGRRGGIDQSQNQRGNQRKRLITMKIVMIAIDEWVMFSYLISILCCVYLLFSSFDILIVMNLYKW